MEMEDVKLSLFWKVLIITTIILNIISLYINLT